MKTTDTALLGHVSPDALAAAALSDLWTMCTAVFIQGRILSVLCGAAVGAGNPKLAGIYLQVSYFVLAGLAVVVFIAWCFTGKVWKAFGSDPEIADMAGSYAIILAISIPAQLAFSQVSQFFQAQRIMHPEVNASAAALVLNLVLGLVLVLGIPIPHFGGYGFIACPSVTTAVVYTQFLVFYVVYIHIQQLHKTCWDKWDMKEITWARIKIFSDMVRNGRYFLQFGCYLFACAFSFDQAFTTHSSTTKLLLDTLYSSINNSQIILDGTSIFQLLSAWHLIFGVSQLWGPLLLTWER